MAGFGLVTAFVLAVTAPTLVPPLPVQGDAVVVLWPDKQAASVRAWLGGEEIPMAATKAGWVGLVGVDLAAQPGPREVTGVTLRKETVVAWRAPFEVTTAGFPVQRLTLADDSKVNLSAPDLKRTAAERAEVGAVLKRRTERKWSGKFKHPLSGNPQGGRFGSLRIINDQPRNPHTGADYGVPKGTPVHATNAGEVVLAAEHFFAGKSVFIDHGDGLISMYFHLDEILARPGDKVLKGEIIGKVGSTGRSSGPHLHFGIHYRGARVNPASLLSRELD